MRKRFGQSAGLSAGILLGLLVNTEVLAEGRSGKDLHDFNCQSCHDNSVYTRENRMIKSMAALKTQIQRCETTLDLGWFEEELNNVADYLNKNYYHFGQ